MLIKFGEGVINIDYIAHLFKVDADVVTLDGHGTWGIALISGIGGGTNFGEKFDNKAQRDARFNMIVNQVNGAK